MLYHERQFDLQHGCDSKVKRRACGRKARLRTFFMEIPESKVREIDRFLNELSSAWIPVRDAAALVQITADAVAGYLQVNRVTFAGMIPDASSAEVEFTHVYRGLTIA